MNKFERNIESFIFFSRWIQLPVYLGLIIGTVMYSLKFMMQLWNLISNFTILTENGIMLSVLGLIDISMVINLLVVVFIGGYSTFVCKMEFKNEDDKPEWLNKVNASTLKIKLIVSLVSVSGVHLLKTFVDIHNIPLQDAILQIVIHLVFLISVVLLAYADKVMHSHESDSGSEH